MPTMNNWENYHDIWVLQTKVGRFVIRRDKRGSRDFHLWLGKKPTTHWGTVEELQKVVNRILYAQQI